MSTLHPSINLKAILSLSARTELSVLEVLDRGLPEGFDVFHNIEYMSFHNGDVTVGELDIVVVSPGGHVLLLEIKSGQLDLINGSLFKVYKNGSKDISVQKKRQVGAMISRLREAHLEKVHVDHMLVLPDYQITGEVVAFPRERIIDATNFSELCLLVRNSFTRNPVSDSQRNKLLAFFDNQFDVEPDVSVKVGSIQSVSKRLASGLATWVPRISHTSGVYIVEATAGSGKTQLALKLLRAAATGDQKACYVCYNRPLADHMIETSPPSVLVSTFHELALNLYRQQMGEPDFSSDGVFDRMAAHFIEHRADKTAWLDLLVIDESQDFKSDWVSALAGQVKSGGKIYVLGDSSQQIYKREPFDIAEAVQITCEDNFRSPSKVVDDINRFKLTDQKVQSRSGWPGEPPVYTVHAYSKAESLRAIATCVQKFIDIGYSPGQIVLVTFSGVKNSHVLKELKVAGLKLRKPTGTFDAAGNALWTEGELLADSVYRIKGQSAPAVIFCEVDFDELNQHTKSKLFVGMTRAQINLEVLLTEKAANLLASAA